MKGRGGEPMAEPGNGVVSLYLWCFSAQRVRSPATHLRHSYVLVLERTALFLVKPDLSWKPLSPWNIPDIRANWEWFVFSWCQIPWTEVLNHLFLVILKMPAATLSHGCATQLLANALERAVDQRKQLQHQQKKKVFFWGFCDGKGYLELGIAGNGCCMWSHP